MPAAMGGGNEAAQSAQADECGPLEHIEDRRTLAEALYSRIVRAGSISIRNHCPERMQRASPARGSPAPERRIGGRTREHSALETALDVHFQPAHVWGPSRDSLGVWHVEQRERSTTAGQSRFGWMAASSLRWTFD